MVQKSADRHLMAAIEAGDCDGARAALLKAPMSTRTTIPHSGGGPPGTCRNRRLLLAAGADHSVHDHRPLRDAEDNGHTETARILREAGSYNPFVPGEFERSIAERVARDYRATGGTDSSSVETTPGPRRYLRRNPKSKPRFHATRNYS